MDLIGLDINFFIKSVVAHNDYKKDYYQIKISIENNIFNYSCKY